MTIWDLLVVGAGPTGIAVGAAARQAGLSVLLVDRGPLCGAIVRFPSEMLFFTTRDKMELAGIPFGIPDDKPNRRQALAYFQGVARHYELPLALYEEVIEARRAEEHLVLRTRKDARERERLTRAMVLATGYFDQPIRLGVPGEDLPWVHPRYLEPYPHFSQHVVVVGAGNSAAETALELWRNGVRVTLVHRGIEIKPSVKYWLRPDIENRIAEGSIAARFNTVVEEFREGDGDEAPERGVVLRSEGRRELLAADAVYVLIGYLPDVELERRCGVELDPETLVPVFDPASYESNVPGLYIAGALQAGRRTDRIFIENSREHGAKIVEHLLSRR
ncbi:MAG: YpdA family putative bacillithiol disulfide reductase [bacterium]|nr:YpdA family putative bacillithiol disulfide reductase [bacterium]